MCRIKFQGGSLDTFLVHDVVMSAINTHFRVDSSPESALSVSFKSIPIVVTTEKLPS